ncbi:MAG TPA: hypothetical protein VF669_10675 [Tepidisphaeraceae bacterium]|jgi:HEAT repeat protein
MAARKVLLFAVILTGCSGYSGPRGLESDDASQLIPAMKRAADEKNTRAVPVLIKALNNDDPAVRFYAIQGLERLTGQTLGYQYFLEADERKEAVARWEGWLKEQGVTTRKSSQAHPSTEPVSVVLW